MNKEYKDWIDNASYEELLRRWRFSENDPIFLGKAGQYYLDKLCSKRKGIGCIAHVAVSKRIGWEKP